MSGKPRQGTCADCGESFIAPPAGPLPKRCPAHAPKNNRKRQAARAAKHGDPLAKLLAGAPEDAERNRAFAPVLLAAGLAVTDDVERAARMMGLPPDLDLEATEAEARAEHGDIIAMRSEAFQRLALLASTLTLARLLPAIGQLPVGQLGPTLKSLMDSAERLQGAVAPTFGGVTVVLTEGDRDA